MGQFGDTRYSLYEFEGETLSKIGDVRMSMTFNESLDGDVFEPPVVGETR